MHPSLLHVVTPRFNPVRYSTPERIFEDWVRHMLASGVHLTVVECQIGDRPFANNLPGVTHIGVRARTVLWVKENLINIGIARLPQDWKYVAWIDSDVFFRNKNWASETVHALQQYDFVQPWSDCYDLGPNDEHLATHRSFCRIHHERKPIIQGAAPPRQAIPVRPSGLRLGGHARRAGIGWRLGRHRCPWRR